MKMESKEMKQIKKYHKINKKLLNEGFRDTTVKVTSPNFNPPLFIKIEKMVDNRLSILN